MGDLSRELATRLSDARFVDDDNLHLTLRFLGATEDRKLEPVRQGLSRIADRFSPLTLSFRGIGFFPNARRPRVLWVGTAVALPSLLALQEEVEHLAVESGFPAEPRAYSPHVTLARFKSERPCRDCPALSTAHAQRDFGDSRVDAVTLFESRLSRSGARYFPIACFPLGAA